MGGSFQEEVSLISVLSWCADRQGPSEQSVRAVPGERLPLHTGGCEADRPLAPRGRPPALCARQKGPADTLRRPPWWSLV